jgi:hypothetical protein
MPINYYLPKDTQQKMSLSCHMTMLPHHIKILSKENFSINQLMVQELMLMKDVFLIIPNMMSHLKIMSKSLLEDLHQVETEEF